MTRQRWIFDDEGDVWPNTAAELTRRLGSRMRPDQLHDYAIANLGFISLEDSSSSIHIRLRKNKVSPIALTSLFYHLCEPPIGKAVLSILDTDWKHEILGNATDLFARLNELSVEIFDGDYRQRFLRETIELDDIGPFDPHAILYRHWQSNRLSKKQNVIDLSDTLFDGRFTIARVLPTSEMIVEHTGRGYTIYNDHYVDRCRGTRYQDEPDTVYGQWVAHTHRDVHRTGLPLLENVVAMIGASRRVRRRVCYRRIVLPFTSPLGERFLVSASTDRGDAGLERRTA